MSFRQVLDKLHPGIEILAWVKSIQELTADVDPQTVSHDDIESNIVRTGEHPLGIGVYEYDIEGRRERGVMAHELAMVKPEAVAVRDDGFLMVDYSLIQEAA